MNEALKMLYTYLLVYGYHVSYRRGNIVGISPDDPKAIGMEIQIG